VTTKPPTEERRVPIQGLRPTLDFRGKALQRPVHGRDEGVFTT
jgi:hypothetical protein